MTLYMIPGRYHCGGRPAAAALDLLTPLMAWVEDNARPERQIVSYHAGQEASTPVSRAQPVTRYPVTMPSFGAGDVNSADSYAAAPPINGVSDELVWAGSKHYRPGEQISCVEDGLITQCR